MYPNIENCCQLHEHVEIHYVVDAYEAFIVRDRGGVMFIGEGPTVAAAMAALDRELEGKTLDDIRGT